MVNMPAPTANMTTNSSPLKRKASQPPEDDHRSKVSPDSKDIDSDLVEPYNVRSESLSTVIVYSSQWSEFLNITTLLHDLLSGPFLEYNGDNDFVRATLANIEKGFNPIIERILVVVAGVMGVGKSHTISSVLHTKVAQSNNASKSVTLVPIYYKQIKKHQTSAFLIEAFFLTDVSIKRVMSHLVKIFYLAQHADQGHGDDDDGEPEVDLGSQNDVAMLLYGLLKEPAGWTSKEGARKFLMSAQSKYDPAVTTKLIDWALGVKRQQLTGTSSQSEHVSVECQAAKDLPKRTERYIGDASSLDVALWPLISHVDVYFDNPLGRLGITVLDAPGGGDVSLRASHAALHVRESTHALLLSDIARPSNTPLFENVKKFKDKGEDGLIVVMPKADVIDANTVLDCSKEDELALADLVKIREELESELTTTKMKYKERKRRKPKVDRSELDELEDRKTELEMALQDAQQAEQWKRVLTRIEFATEELRQRLRDITKFVRDIPVYGVANTIYDAHAKGFAVEDAPLLSVEQTYIPCLRRTICEQTVNPASLRRANHLVANSIPGVMREVQVFAGARATHILAEARQCVAVPVDVCDELVTAFKRLILDDLKANILNQCDLQRSSWNSAAAKKCGEWMQKYKSRAFLSMMQHDGYRKAEPDSICINTRLQSINKETLEDFFDDTPTFRSRVDTLVVPLENLLTNMVKDLKVVARQKDLPFSDFCALVDQKKLGIASMLHDAGVRFEDSFSAIKGRAIRMEDDAFIRDVMLPIYAEISDMKSTGTKKLPKEYKSGGYHKWRCAEFTGKVKADCWRKIVTSIDRALQDAVDEMYTDILALAKGLFQGLLETFDHKMNAKETSEEDLTLQKRIKANLEVAEMEFKKLAPLYNAMNRQFGVGAKGQVGSTKVKDESDD
nr:hypothetical protein B0A51_07310 [Rachicladosporium sp. CCFEE 5018]